MYIDRIDVENFKSFETLTVKLGNFNVVIGPNASGKSNFVRIFEFLRDIMNFGLNNAISLQGGVEYLRNMKIGASKNLTMKIVSLQVRHWIRFGLFHYLEGNVELETTKTTYEFALNFSKGGYEIAKDELSQTIKFFKTNKGRKREELRRELIGEGELVIHRSNGELNVDLNMPENVPLRKEDIIENFLPSFLREEKLPDNVLLLEIPHIRFLSPFEEILRSIAIYDFDPKLPKKAIPITGKAELEEDGQNLSIILKNILEDEEKSRKLFNLVKELLPFVENLGVERFVDKSLLFKLQENYFGEYIPASLVSDGTISIIALVIALYFEKKQLVIIEEPERNIHPYLISKIVNMMKDASKKKQIIVTTHNPEFVKHAGLENILLVARNENGFSKITRPLDREEVRMFLKNDIGIDELYVQNLL